MKTRSILWTVRASTFSLRSHKDPFAFFTVLSRCSDHKISMKFYLILRKLHRKGKTIKFRPHAIYNFFGPFNCPRRLFKGWHLFPFHPVYLATSCTSTVIASFLHKRIIFRVPFLIIMIIVPKGRFCTLKTQDQRPQFFQTSGVPL